MNKEKYKIGIDIDGTINNMCECVLKVYNEDSGDNLKVEDITDYYMEKFVKEEFKKNFHKYFVDKRVWKQVEINKEAKEYISKLNSEGYTVYFVTSTEPENISKKASWLQREFPDINIRKRLIRCYNKQLLSGLDILVDDYSKNLVDGNYVKILLDKPWNRDVDDCRCSIRRANNWKDIYILILGMFMMKVFQDRRQSGNIWVLKD